jgi:hypothetical protein
MLKRSDSRGLSTIVATLIIILLVLVAVGILWVVVRNVIQTNSEQVSLGKLTLDLSIERIQISGNNLSITVKRNAGKGEFVGLSFVVEDGENSEVFTEYVSMNELDVKTFTFTLNQTNPDNIKKIKIVPIFRLKSGKEFVGEVKDTWEKSSSSGISQCTSNCPFGAECGSNGCLGGTCGTCSDPTPTCVNYQCVAQQTCTSNCTGRTCGSDGCEGNCGTCTNLHGTTSCVTGNCQPVCDLGYDSCDLIASNGCETLLGTIANCANCSNSCLTGQNCTGDVCMTPQVPTCGDGTCNGTETCSNCVSDCACLNGFTCQINGTCMKISCADSCTSLNYNCGNHNFCGTMTNCGNCGPTEDCNSSSWQCVIGPCDDNYFFQLGYNCGYQFICGTNITCGTCSYGLTCVNSVCVPINPCTETCANLGYGCGMHTVCGVPNTDCGDCGAEETCRNNLCIATSCTNGAIDIGETGVDCGGICIDCVITTNPLGDIFYVAVNGSDSNNGTSLKWPWATWEKAFAKNNGVGPGDLVYFMGGVYYRNSLSVPLNSYGTPNAPIRYFAYPGQRPIWDGKFINSSSTGYILNIHKDTSDPIGPSNLHFKGLEIRNFKDNEGAGYFTAIVVAWGYNITFEEMVMHDNTAAQISTYSLDIGKLEYINCDFYNNFDPWNPSWPGNQYSGGASRGFTVNSRNVSSYTYVEGVRTWNNSDGGFSLGNDGIAVINNTWTFFNGYAGGDGDGWKGSPYTTGHEIIPNPNDIRKTVRNTISAGNRLGFIDNVEYSRMEIYNMFIYDNGHQYPIMREIGGIDFCETYSVGSDIFRNNIEYNNALMRDIPNANCFKSGLIHSNNTWDSPITITDADFLNLDITELMRPRKVNGSLPDVQFGHLAPGSVLIDKGTNVGLPYSGSAPDLGPFESNY